MKESLTLVVMLVKLESRSFGILAALWMCTMALHPQLKDRGSESPRWIWLLGQLS